MFKKNYLYGKEKNLISTVILTTVKPIISYISDCPRLNLSDHLQTNSSITTFGTYVLFYCDNGYQLAGTSVLICDIGGRWSTSPPTCNGKSRFLLIYYKKMLNNLHHQNFDFLLHYG